MSIWYEAKSADDIDIDGDDVDIHIGHFAGDAAYVSVPIEILRAKLGIDDRCTRCQGDGGGSIDGGCSHCGGSGVEPAGKVELPKCKRCGIAVYPICKSCLADAGLPVVRSAGLAELTEWLNKGIAVCDDGISKLNKSDDAALIEQVEIGKSAMQDVLAKIASIASASGKPAGETVRRCRCGSFYDINFIHKCKDGKG